MQGEQYPRQAQASETLDVATLVRILSGGPVYPVRPAHLSHASTERMFLEASSYNRRNLGGTSLHC